MAKYEVVGEGKYLHREGDDNDTHLKLPSGVYETFLVDSPFGKTPLFREFKSVHDDLVDLPSAEYRQVLSEIDTFLDPKTEIKYNDMGFVYKRGVLLHGKPGTGKTCIINKVVQKVVKNKKGIVLFNPDVHELSIILDSVSRTNPDSFIMVIFEEFETLGDSSTLLSLLDGEIQKDKVIYLATTNYFERLPERLIRPGRFASLIEVKAPDRKCRRVYLKSKFGSKLGDLNN